MFWANKMNRQIKIGWQTLDLHTKNKIGLVEYLTR